LVDERVLLRDALTRGLGAFGFEPVKTAFEARVAAGEFIQVHDESDTALRRFTTREMIALEQDLVARMRDGQGTHAAFRVAHASDLARDYPHLSDSQRAAVAQILASCDQVMGLDGVAGAGKTTTLAVIREEAERVGYRVDGFAPTSRAAQQLAESGIVTKTLQRHLMADQEPDQARHLYVLDESSLASTRQVHAFVERLGPGDRVLLVGDVRQHQAVEAGRPYQQLQEAGMQTAHLDAIVRQRDPALRAVVERLSRGEVMEAIQQLDAQGRVHAIADTAQRLDAVARAYLRDPAGTLVVSPDNASRTALNQRIHRARQEDAQVDRRDHRVRVLLPRQDVTGADRHWAARYAPGDVVRYTTGSRTLGLGAGEYARVAHVNADENLVTVRRAYGARITYDPRRLYGVTLYREADRAFAVGDRVQITAPDREHQIANRELGTVEQIDRNREVRLRLDSRRTVVLPAKTHVHLDYGYAVTSHSSQGHTADRVVLYVDTEQAAEPLVNRRLAYVALSRARYDAQIYTNDTARLVAALQRDFSHASAIEVRHAPAHAIASEPAAQQKIDRSIGFGL
jgi:ATP-dependent exoDNAse (exonuclease V) alpha subunit